MRDHAGVCHAQKRRALGSSSGLTARLLSFVTQIRTQCLLHFSKTVLSEVFDSLYEECKMFKSESKTCCLISGASRGFGRSVAVALARQFSDSGTKGHFILISRSRDDLEETRNRIIQVCATTEGKAQDI